MTFKQEKREFTAKLLNSFKEDILNKFDKFPDEWEATEIREYIQQKAENAFVWEDCKNKKRAKQVHNDILVNNL